MSDFKCWKCDNKSEITVQASGHFCGLCFIEYFRHKYHKIVGSSKLLRHGDVIVFGFDGSLNGLAMLDIVERQQKAFDEEPEIKRKGKKVRYQTKVIHLNFDEKTPDYIKKALNDSCLESKIVNISEEEFRSISERAPSIKRFNDVTEENYNKKQIKKALLAKHAADFGGKFCLTSSNVETLAAETLTNVCLGLGSDIQSTASLKANFYGIDFLRPFREMTLKEIKFYCDLLNFSYEGLSDHESLTKSVQSLASSFLLDLNSEGKGSNPTAIVKISDKIKS